MKQLPSRLRRLDDALADLPLDEPMLLTELDGFLTGIIVCPELIMPSEWLPVIWAGDGASGAPFDDPADVKWFVDAVMARYNEIVRALARGKLQPIFDIDERNGDILWELWVDGFETAMGFRPDCWSFPANDEETGTSDAIAGMTMLFGIAAGDSTLMSHEVNQVNDEAPFLISTYAVQLYRWRLSRDDSFVPPAQPVKTGRNDPCTCGSGKKFKRCCGLN